MHNISMFELLYPTFKIDKPVRLIELFAGVGSQAMALRNLGVDFKPHRISEWEVSAFASYKAIHNPDDSKDYSKGITKEQLIDILFELGISNNGKEPMTLEQISNKSEKWLRETYNNIKATSNLVNIMKIKGEDLAITDTERYIYILTYSFPCQDLSLAGNRQGMSKGSGTRSGLLWEVERLLDEVSELPQVLLMENVPQVLSDQNIEDFQLWSKFLESKGYMNYTDTLNAKDYGVAQNRNRTFMVSLLGEYSYSFPQSKPLEKTIKDYLEETVDEKYYINNEKAQSLIEQLIDSGQLIDDTNYADRSINEPRVKEIANCITTKDRGISNQKSVGGIIAEVKQIGNIMDTGNWDNPQAGRIYSAEGICPTLNTMQGGGREPKIVEPIIVASRGRNKQNPSDRTPGVKVEQRLEPNSQGICNTLTSVQKDNLVLEPTVKIRQATKEGYIECKIGGGGRLVLPRKQNKKR